MNNVAFEISSDVHQSMSKDMQAYLHQITVVHIKLMESEIRAIAIQNPWSRLAQQIGKIFRQYEINIKTELKKSISALDSGNCSFVQIAKGIKNYDEIIEQSKQFQNTVSERILNTVPSMTDYGKSLVAEINKKDNAKFDVTVINQVNESIMKCALNIKSTTLEYEKKEDGFLQKNRYYAPLKGIIHKVGTSYHNGLVQVTKQMEKVDKENQELIRETVQNLMMGKE